MPDLAAALLGALVAFALSTVAAVVFLRRVAHGRVAQPGDAPAHDADRTAFRAMRDAGVDPATPAEMSFYLYFPTLRAAERASAQVAALRVDAPSLAVRIERTALGASYLCRVTMRATPSEPTIRAASTQLHAVAAEHGGRLDGWEVAVPW